MSGTKVADAYVSIIPETKGFSGKLKQALGGSEGGGDEAGSMAGKLFGSGMMKAVAALGIGAAIGKVIKDSITSGGELQQSIGGIETLFGDASDKMVQYANNAFQTAGLSANDYMQTATSFSASLLQSLGGDTQKAADYANKAIVDMSDNANKMGTSMESIQAAYQGFSKQNYTIKLMSAA